MTAGGRRSRVRRRAAVLGSAAGLLVLALGTAPAGGAVARPPTDLSYSLLGSSWTFGVFSTGILQEPDFRFPYTQGNASVVVRPVVRGDAAWFDPGFIVRDAQANPSEKPCPPADTPEGKKCAADNKKTQDNAIATYRYPFLARCLYPDPPNSNYSDPLRIFERRDFSDNGFPKPPPTQSGNATAFGAVAYGESSCQEDYSVNLRAVTDELVVGAESAPTIQAASLKSVTKLFFDGPDRSTSVAQTTSTAQGVKLLGGAIAIDKLSVTAEARSNGEASGAKVSSAMKIVGASVGGVPVEIRRDGVFASTAAFPTDAQRKTAQDQANAVLASLKIKVRALAVDQRVENDGQDAVIEGGGIKIDWILPQAQRPSAIDSAIRALTAPTPVGAVTLPETVTDTLSIQLGHVNMIAHAVKTSPVAAAFDPGLSGAASSPLVLGEQLRSRSVPTFATTYQAPTDLGQAVSQPQPTNVTPASTPLRPLVKLPAWAVLLLALAAGTAVSATYTLTRQRVPIPPGLEL